MKHSSEYAQEVKRLFKRLLKQSGKPEIPAPVDPLDQLVLGILSGCTTDHKAAVVYKHLREQTVDLNELRVTPPVELAEMIGTGVPLAKEKAQRIVDALNAVRRRQDKLDLSFLAQRARREAREYLESLEGVDKATAASVMLFSLGGHAIPVDEVTLYVLRQEKLVDPGAELAEVQAFLERTIAADETPVFALLLSRYAAQKGARLSADKLREMVTPPKPPAPPPPPVLPVPPVEPPVAVKPPPPPGKDGKHDGRAAAHASPTAPAEKATKAPVTATAKATTASVAKGHAPTANKPHASAAAKPAAAKKTAAQPTAARTKKK